MASGDTAQAPIPAASPACLPLWRKVLLALLGVLAALLLVLAFFPWDWLRGPINRMVSERTGRHFEITRRLDVKLGRTVTVIADGLVFANPAWAQEPNLVTAEGARMQLRLWPLLRHRQLRIPQLALQAPRLALEARADGRRTWSLRREGGTGGEVEVDELVIDAGRLRYVAPHQGADITADFAIEGGGSPQQAPAAMPLAFSATGRWRGEVFNAQGRTGSVLALREARGQPFPLSVRLAAGRHSLRADGTVRGLARLEGADLRLELRGPNLAELYELTGVVLPATPAYAARTRLRRDAARWRVDELAGTVGSSDLAGGVVLDTSREVPRLSGALQSRRLDFDDLAPLVGLRHPKERAPGASARRSAQLAQPALSARGSARVLPDTALDLARLRRMDADLRYEAARVVNVRQLPLERLAAHVRLDGGALKLDPLELGVAGGRVAGRLHLDASQPKVEAPDVALALSASNLQLQRLFPAVDLNRASIGRVHGRVDLSGKGRSVAQLLGSAQGDVALLVGQGRISNLLLEMAGLDGGEIIKFMMGHDQRINLRCGAVAFGVRGGVMQSRALVLDTVDTVVYGQGAIDLRNETIDLVFHPYPKDKSILALRSPLRLGGTLGQPRAGVDKATLAARAGIVIALGAINPLLGLAATVETGPGQDADCAAVLREAARPRQAPASVPR